ncbi:MAG TPA: (Fe-S)-binding protein [Bacilli bacterium]|nr:(Fe-S)-binding protein [Bacilli bacterium]
MTFLIEMGVGARILVAVAVLFAVGGVLGLLLALADKKLRVEVDERLTRVHELLPNINCGSCGYPGCAGFAAGVLSGEVTSLTQCRPSAGRKGSREAISEYLASTPGPDGKTINIK